MSDHIGPPEGGQGPTAGGPDDARPAMPRATAFGGPMPALAGVGAAVPPRRVDPPGAVALALTSVPPWAARGVLGVALIAGALVVGEPLGLGLTLVLLGLLAIGARVRRPATADLRAQAAALGRDRWTRAWWVLAAGLALVPTLRAALWVVIPCVIVCVATASLAAAGARRWGELWANLAAVWVWMPGGAYVAGTVAARGASFGPAARGAALAVALLAVFVPLLVTADAAFAELLDGLAPSLDMPVARVFVAVVFLAVGGGLLLVAVAPFRPARVQVRRTLTRLEWALPLGALVVLLGGFVALQLTILFGGDGYVRRTADLTYAEYARTGFGQLVVVAALTLAVIAAAGRWARDTGSLLRTLLGALCVLTLVMLVSALHRLELLEDAYGFTRLRFTAHAILIWLGALFALVLVARGAAWLPRAALTITIGAFLVFALADPDRRIAAWNVDRYERTGKVDATYLGWLSVDAIPELRGMECVPRMPERSGLGGFNLGRERAIASGVTGPACDRPDWG